MSTAPARAPDSEPPEACGVGIVVEQANQFLQLLDPTAPWFTFQTFADGRDDDTLARVVSSPAFPSLLELHARGAGVYVTVNATNRHGIRSNANVNRVRAIWQEDDNGYDGPFPLPPSMVVETSPGHYHRWWLVADDWPADEQGRADFEGVIARMVESYGSDPNAKDIARVLRLPGFLHRKERPAVHLVRIIEANGHRYTRQQILEAFPPIAREAATDTEPGNVDDDIEDVRIRVRAALPKISAYDRPVWLRVGMILKKYLGQAGRKLWDEWAASCKDKFKDRDQEKAWRSFRRTDGGLTLATLYYYADQADPEREWRRRADAEIEALLQEQTRIANTAGDALMMKELGIEAANDDQRQKRQERPKTEPPKASTSPATGSVIVRASDVPAQAKDWLWEGHLPLGTLELISGLPGVGKSLAHCSLVASATAGKPWPDGTKPTMPPCNVIMLTAEDALADELIPRLQAAGADLNRVYILKAIRKDAKTQRHFLLGEDLEQLARDVQRIGDVKLITIDPITAYMGGKMDSHKTTEVRSQLTPLKDFAEQHHVLVSAITHPAKNPGKKAIDHFIGSQAFIAAARVGHVCVEEFEEEDDEGGGRKERVPTGRVLFGNPKNNTHRKMPTLAYRIQVKIVGRDKTTGKDIEAPFVVWEGTVDITADQAVAMAVGGGDSGGGKRDEAIAKATAFLEEMLKDEQPVPSKLILEAAKAQGITKYQLRRAKDKMNGVEVVKDGLGAWVWQFSF